MLVSRFLGLVLGSALLLGASAAPADAAPASVDGRYAIAGGCFALRSQALGRLVAKSADGGYAASAEQVAGAEPFRMQATDLAKYLFYGPRADFLGTDSQGKVTSAPTPSETADWRVEDAGAGAFRITLPSGKVLSASPGSGALVATDAMAAGPQSEFSFVKAGGCAVYPEIDTNTVGEPARGATPFGDVTGYMDGILHLMAFEFIGGSLHCGRPWHPYGVAYALVDCPDHAPNGLGAAAENALSFGNPVHTHDPSGWPTFTGWPTAPSLTHEQVYYKWLERAWRGGQRLIVDVMVDNAALCEVYPLKRNPCDEMNTARLEIADSYKLQDYIDAQSGGPGKGWFRIVTTPFQARQVANEGKLAVVLGMETSRLFGCRLLNDVPQCDRAQIDRGLEEFSRLGVRSLQLVNKFDNALTGVAADAGTTGIVINSGNRNETGHYWQLQTCTGPGEDREQTAALPSDDESAFARGLAAFAPPGTLPVYPPAPHCNQRGLTDLGDYLIRRMMQRGMIIDLDHTSVLGRNQALSIIEAARYSGVISTHGWSTPDSFPRIYKLGGMVTPYAGDSTGFVKEWKQDRVLTDKRFGFPFGYGSDISGLGAQGNPRGKNAPNPVTYPFKSLDGAVTLNRQTSGQRVWDVNTDGVAQYGLYPDWIQDLRKLAGDQIVNDLSHGAEGYISMWERAQGVPAQHCQPARGRLTQHGLARLLLGASNEALLRSAGQPLTRPGYTWTYCANARDGRPAGQLITVLDPAGTVSLVASTGREHDAANVHAGERVGKLPRSARRYGANAFVSDAGGGTRFVFGTRKGRIRFVGVATKAASYSRTRLHGYLKLAGLSP